MESCPICNEPMSYSRGEVHTANCPRCSTYRISDEAISDIRNSKYDLRQRANASGWLSENSGYLILNTNIDQIFSHSTPSFHNRADKLLLGVEKQTKYIGEGIHVSDSWLSIAWCLNSEELVEIILYLISTDRLLALGVGPALDEQYKIGPVGWEHIELLKGTNRDSSQGFVAMWFDDRLQNVYDTAISKGISDAGYKPHRVDQREHNNKIDDEIIAQIRRSRFIVADFTGHRGGVYYEAGFAQGIGLEVVWTCEKKDIDMLHFDVRQYNCLTWDMDELDNFRERISFRIERAIGRGNYRVSR